MKRKRVPLVGVVLVVLGAAVAGGVWYFTVHQEANVSGTSSGGSELALTTADTKAPSVPTGLTVTGTTTSTISLSWNPSTDNVGVAGYIIYRANVVVAKVPSTSYTDTGLASNYAYSYAVAAYDAAGNISGESPNVVGITQTGTQTIPTVPTGLAASVISSSQINLSWNPSSETSGTIAGYTIYRGGTQLTKVSATSYSDVGLSPSTTYSYTVSAYDTKGNSSAQSSAVSATTLSVSKDTKAPSVPTNLKVTGTTTSSISISWTASTDNVGVAGYIIYRNGTQFATTSAVTYTNTGHASNYSYNYAVAAYDAAGNISGESPNVVGTTQSGSDTTPPSVPQNLATTAVTTSTISLSWSPSTDNVGVAGYKIYRNAVQVGTTAAVSYTDTGLTSSTLYKYTVSAYDAAGNNSAQSAPLSVTTQAISGPSIPQNLTVTGTTTSTISLSWSASTESGGKIVGYEVYRGAMLVGVPVGTTYTDIGLAANEPYSYVVESVDALGKTSQPSAVVTGTTKILSSGGLPVINYFNVAPAGALLDQNVILTVDATNTASVTIAFSPCTPPACYVGNGKISATYILWPPVSTTYTLTATNGSGTVTMSQGVTIGAYNNNPPPVPAGLSVPSWKACWVTSGGHKYQGMDFTPTIPTPPHGLPIEASLYWFSDTCSNGGGDNLNDYQSDIYSGSQTWYFINHPDIPSSSAIWSLGNLSSGCVDYAKAPAC